MRLTLLKDHALPTGVLGLAITPDAAGAFAACADGSVYSVETESGVSKPFEAMHASYAAGCVLSTNGRTLITAGYDGRLIWHDVVSRRKIRAVQAHQFWNWQLAMSPDGGRLATVTGQYLPGGWKYEPAAETEPSVKLFDASTGERIASFTHVPPVQSCAFSPDGQFLAAANMLGEVRVWDLTAGDIAKPVSQWNCPDFTSWGTIKTHHYCGGIHGLAFSPDGESLLGCGMGPMVDPMAGNGKMTWIRWAWRKGERADRIRDDDQGAGLMESVAWRPDGGAFVMAGRQAQGTWNAAIFNAADGKLVCSVDTKKRITHARFSSDGGRLVLAGAKGQPAREKGKWPDWGRIQTYSLEI
jgi:WD40 repeat protein